jgi:Rrf2 family nitric oxide-sensitive transcriptional repressor
MQLTRFTDYSLRVLMYLSYRQDELTTIAELAKRYRVSSNHLMKVVHHLAQLHYIETVRGKGGGMRLARRPEEVNLAAVIEDCEQTTAVIECLAPDYDGDCPLMPHCQLRSVLQDAQKAFLAYLEKFTLQDLVANPGVRSVLHHESLIDDKR